jgi:hypothetical protein
MTTRYHAVLFAPDGDYVTDYDRNTVEEVWEAINDQGSRWIFYPIPFVIRNHRTTWDASIVSCPDLPNDMLLWLRGRAVKTIARMLADGLGNDIITAWQ